MAVKMIKVHGSGNDFYLLDQTQFPEPLTDKGLKQLAINICKRDGAGSFSWPMGGSWKTIPRTSSSTASLLTNGPVSSSARFYIKPIREVRSL